MYISKKVIIILLVILSVVLLVLFNTRRVSCEYKKEMPADFNFWTRVDFDTYTLDTYKGTLTKQISWNKDTTISFRVTNDFKEQVYSMIRDIDICKYPCNYAPTSTSNILPSSSYYFKYTMDSVTNEINWIEHTHSQNRDAKRLRSLFEVIFNYIEQDAAAKALPRDERALL